MISSSNSSSSAVVKTMSVTRKWFGFSRIFRNRSVQLLCLLFFVVLFSKWGPSGTKIVYQRSAGADVLPPSGEELPGAADEKTVYTKYEIGNFEPSRPEEPGSQPGEGGWPVRSTDEQQSRAAVSEFGFDTFVSDQISLTRTIPDIRMDQCKNWQYRSELPSVSVVIVFHNEGWSPLLRTVHSVLLRSPSDLLKEIVMVDDFSDKQHLKEKLEKYLLQFEGKVRLVRSGERLGLIGARNLGAKSARGEVVVFLDAHCEVNVNWLPPLLAPIKKNRKVMTVPVIDSIDAKTWEYRGVYGQSDRHFSGIFEWGLLYKETLITEREKSSRTYASMPFRSPTHAGGLFAIDREWFAELGYYDDGLKIWGGEQYELSFKIWMCGGGILIVPCSHVGHVYRHQMPYNFGKYSGKPTLSTNMKRVVKTWMGDYEKYYLTREPQAANVDPGDLSAQLAIKEKLQCKDFHWYMENVAYDVLPSYPLLPPNRVWGSARNHHTGRCLERMGAIPGRLGAGHCHQSGGTQLLRLNEKGQLAQGEWCLLPRDSGIRSDHCVKGTVDGPWNYDEQTQQIVAGQGSCITISADKQQEIELRRCEQENRMQKFVWTPFYQ